MPKRQFDNLIQTTTTTEMIPGVFTGKKDGSLHVELVGFTLTNTCLVKIGHPDNRSFGVDVESAAVLSDFFAELAKELDAERAREVRSIDDL